MCGIHYHDIVSMVCRALQTCATILPWQQARFTRHLCANLNDAFRRKIEALAFTSLSYSVFDWTPVILCVLLTLDCQFRYTVIIQARAVPRNTFS